ncbi:DeoR/GlpR family DNA-binding transcription regulator [Ferviditalea candida]|uniref:DeoR/GlpR family DNA-binding transcription regulator n=1 Tax=Ferviditalea candida TaxID=3108399 RepID=A0ABU5ZI65_9BACL|nr:DeoR/GlpR family DNA-binding transcription regulator [Paenibacillaceae bacterium T2]
MLSEERKRMILDLLQRDGKVSVIPLSRELSVSAETIRRDLDVLEKEGKLHRVYGGATNVRIQGDEPPYIQRQSQFAQEKAQIGRKAAGLIEDGDHVVIDVGTTTLEMARAIQGKKRLTVLTNSFPVASYLMESLKQERFTGRVILLGGELNPQQLSISGELCQQMMKQFRVDKAFISVGGVSLEEGITDYDVHEALMSRMFADAAREAIVLADHSKIGVNTFIRIFPLEAVGTIISDAACPKEWTRHLKKNGVVWIKA